MFLTRQRVPNELLAKTQGELLESNYELRQIAVSVRNRSEGDVELGDLLRFAIDPFRAVMLGLIQNHGHIVPNVHES